MSAEMPIRRGVHHGLEEEANAILKEAFKGVTRHRDKSDILTPWKAAERAKREVMVPSGTPDGTVRRGSFHRAWNPEHAHLNSAEGLVSARRRTTFTDWDAE